MNDRGIKTSYLLFLLFKIINPENTSQLKLVKDSNPNRFVHLLLHQKIPVALYNILLTIRDTDREFELKGNLLRMITNKNYKKDLAKLEVKKLMFDFAKEMYFYVRAPVGESI